MATSLRPELSERNPYWIERHRYYELKHFCLQYPIWKKALLELEKNGMSKGSTDISGIRSGNISDPTAECVAACEKYRKRMELVELTAQGVSFDLGDYILTGVTEGLSYDNLAKRYDIPCCKDVYYNLYRKFFWLLDMRRD
ncbi:MAG: hypothetical protein LUE29_09480 [Lachnospiraceae bacterium]|nr:hypothetical protein [Lachnospiraceae bacterium]